MADDDEREGLLTNDDNRTRRRKANGFRVSSAAVNVDDRRQVYEHNSNDPECTARNSLLTLSECDFIIAVFVVAFDTKTGNVIEWCLPEDVDLEGVEFKAMTSGSHTLRTDFVYFRKNNLYGLACFENMPVDSQTERGARMKSVGILATSYTLLYRHMQFLETQVRNLLHHGENNEAVIKDNLHRHQLEIPGRYGQLMAFWEDKKATLPSSVTDASTGRGTHLVTSRFLGDLLPSELKVTHPNRCFSQFMQFFGHQSLTLWKFALLGKRILFFSPPPIGVVCYRVYCCCCLANHSMHNRLMSREIKPHFYVNVADIDTIESEISYIACTTEKIFETKPHLYDVYVDNQNVTVPSPAMKDMLKVSNTDRDKFLKLNNHRARDHQFTEEEDDDTMSEEDMFTAFFIEQNNRIFQTLIDASQSQDRQLTSEHMKMMGLDPVGDRSFLMELVEVYGIDVMLIVDNPCCPT